MRVLERRVCTWCQRPIPIAKRRDSKFCCQKCRQASHRFALERAVATSCTRPMRFAYCDPPYPGKAHYYPEASEVDHAALIRRLAIAYPDGWALSTSAEALRYVWQWCPFARLCVWVKAPRVVKTKRLTCSFEALLVAGGRDRRLAVADRSTCDVLLADPQGASEYSGDTSPPAGADGSRDTSLAVGDALIYRGRHRAFPGAMVGMKPPAFAEWMFRLLGALPGDTLDDLFPGSGAITEAWERFAGCRRDVSMKAVASAGQGDGSEEC
jgi:hypothetical protein